MPRPNKPPKIVSVTATPNPTGSRTTILSALGSDDQGEANLKYTWASLLSGVTFSANATNAAKNCTATFPRAGAYPLTIRINDMAGLSVSANLSVTVNQTLTTIVLSPGNVNLSGGATQQFVAVAKDQFGTPLAVPPLFVWSVVGGGTVSQTGLYTAPLTSATATLRATVGSLSGTATAIVTAAANPPTVAVPPSATPNPVTGMTANLSVLGADDAGEALLTYTWSCTVKPIGAATPTFSVNGTNAAKNTVATFFAPGSYTFQVTIMD